MAWVARLFAFWLLKNWGERTKKIGGRVGEGEEGTQNTRDDHEIWEPYILETKIIAADNLTPLPRKRILLDNDDGRNAGLKHDTIVNKTEWLGSPTNIKGANKDANIYVGTEGPWPCTIFCFALIHYAWIT